MRFVRLLALCGFVGLSAALLAAPQNPPAPAGRPGVTPTRPPATQRGGRRSIAPMALSASAWPDGGQIPAKHTQAGDDVSPALTWSGVPADAVSFVLLVHDVDAAIGDGTSDILHWLLWNVPGTSTGLPEHLPAVSELPDGTRQISQSGPYYRGPGAMAAGPVHHYVFELFALDTMLDVPAVGASPADTRAAVLAAMAGHVRGKGVYVGLFKRPPS